jgi:hypothetical protein
MTVHYPVKLRKAGNELYQTALMLSNYIGHAGSIGKDHPLRDKLIGCIHVYMDHLFAFEDAQAAKKKRRR